VDSREIILGRIREALRAPSPRHAVDSAPREWRRPAPETVDGQIDLFRKNAEELRAEFFICADIAEATERARSFAWKKVALHSGELTDAVAGGLGVAQVRTDKGYALGDLESCDAGLTECEALVAQTGSVLVSSGASGGRALSVLPPHHVVLARRGQMVSDLGSALRNAQTKYRDGWPSCLSFVTGPSRTGDIERILVLGAHGPRRLTILLLP